MKDLLIITFVFGVEYQGYIPIYLYSLYINYPEYDSIIYIDRKLAPKYNMMLTNIPGYSNGKYKIKEVGEKFDGLPSQQKKAYRWLKFENEYLKYKFIYIGDIDIFICKERVPLHVQHINHMRAQNTIFSNIVRDNDSSKFLMKYEGVLNKLKVYRFLEFIYLKLIYHKRLSGLHFVETRLYYSKTEKYRKKYLKCFESRSLRNYLINLDMFRYTNEALLYKIVKKSGISVPTQVQNNKSVLDCTNILSNEFRPYHGIHFGIWRQKGIVDDVYADFLKGDLSISYYKQFEERYRNDYLLKLIIDNNDHRIKKIVNDMVYYYKNVVGVL